MASSALRYIIPFQMSLDELSRTIRTLAERIRDHSALLSTSEARTRLALVDPLLNALGWDTSDPAKVSVEYDVEGRQADYALLGPDGKPKAFVEAKKLGERLDRN